MSHKNHSRSKSGHKKTPHVALDIQRILIGYDTYVWEVKDNYDSLGRHVGFDIKWYRVSKTRIKRDGKEIRFVDLKDRSRKRKWEDVLRPIKDRKLIWKLEHAKDRAEDKKDRLEREAADREYREKKAQKQLQKEVLAADRAELPESDSSASSASASDSGKAIKRDNHGVRLYSNDEKHFFNFQVSKSRNYPGCATISLFCAGRPLNYTLNKRKMEALLREVIRGFSIKELKKVLDSLKATT